jgi:hypothetical protein
MGNRDGDYKEGIKAWVIAPFLLIDTRRISCRPPSPLVEIQWQINETTHQDR